MIPMTTWAVLPTSSWTKNPLRLMENTAMAHAKCMENGNLKSQYSSGVWVESVFAAWRSKILVTEKNIPPMNKTERTWPTVFAKPRSTDHRNCISADRKNQCFTESWTMTLALYFGSNCTQVKTPSSNKIKWAIKYVWDVGLTILSYLLNKFPIPLQNMFWSCASGPRTTSEFKTQLRAKATTLR